MEPEPNKKELMARYLLGELSEQEREQVIDKYLGDDDFFEQMLSVEEDLVNDYAQDQLPRRERERFESHYLTPPQQMQRVKRAKAFHTAASLVKPPKPSWWRSLLDSFSGPLLVPRYSLAAATLLILLAGTWLAVETVRLRSRVGQSQSEQAALRQREQNLLKQVTEQRGESERLASELQRSQDQLRETEAQRATLQRHEQELLRLQGQTTPPNTQISQTRPASSKLASFVLNPSLFKERGPLKEFAVGPGVDLVRLQLDLEGDDYNFYRVELRTFTGNEIFSQSGLKTQMTKTGKAVVVSFSAGQVPIGDSLLTLSGMTDGGTYKEVGRVPLRFVQK